MRAAARCGLLVLCLALPAGAGEPRVDGMRALLEHMSGGVPTTRVGDWVTYRLLDAAGGRQAFWRIGVAGEEKDAQGRDALWIDVEMGEHAKMRAPLAQVRLLVAKDPGPDGQAVSRVYFAWGTQRIKELTPDAVRWVTRPGTPGPPDPEDLKERTDRSKVRVINGKEQRLMTLAGTVTAVPVEVRYGSVVLKRVWLSRELPILQLAKIDFPPVDHSLEVREFGTDYRSQMVLPAPGQPQIGIEKWAPLPPLPEHPPEDEDD